MRGVYWMNLNIIGNGFDLFHGLPSSYYFFGCYLIKNHPEFYEQIGKMYDLKYANVYRTYPEYEFEYEVEDIFWRDFEKHLGDVNEDFILYTYEDDLGLENDDPIDIEMDEDLAAENLKKSFVHWVKDTLDKEENYRLIKMFMKKETNKIEFGRDDYFLVFNYTHTLQKIYKIPDNRIHYVHGECMGQDDDNLIIGHGNDDRIREIEKIIELYDEKDDYTQRSRNEKNEYKCLLRYVERLRKDVDFCMNMCEWFYSEINTEPEIINVYGMSLGYVDIPYLMQIREKWPNVQWLFSYYSMDDETRIVEMVRNVLRLEDEKYDVFKFINPVGNEIQEKIIRRQDIIEYDKFKL